MNSKNIVGILVGYASQSCTPIVVNCGLCIRGHGDNSRSTGRGCLYAIWDSNFAALTYRNCWKYCGASGYYCIREVLGVAASRLASFKNNDARIVFIHFLFTEKKMSFQG